MAASGLLSYCFVQYEQQEEHSLKKKKMSKQNILILWDCSPYEKHQKYVACYSAGYIWWVDPYNICDKDKELKSNLR